MPPAPGKKHSLNFYLGTPIYIYIYICVCTKLSLSLSLSLYMYIYIWVYAGRYWDATILESEWPSTRSLTWCMLQMQSQCPRTSVLSSHCRRRTFENFYLGTPIYRERERERERVERERERKIYINIYKNTHTHTHIYREREIST